MTVFHSNYEGATKAHRRARFWDKITRIVTLGISNQSEQVRNATAEEYRRHRELEEFLLNTQEYANLKAYLSNARIEGTGITKVVPLSSVTVGSQSYGDDWDDTSRYIRNRDAYICQEADGNCYGQLQVHHIIFLSRGGTNSEGNLITLCKYHHSLKHPHMQI